jgi:hypothetical protein
MIVSWIVQIIDPMLFLGERGLRMSENVSMYLFGLERRTFTITEFFT